MFALALPLVIGGAAFGVETTYWYVKRAAMQTAADAAAYAAALEGRSGSEEPEIVTVASLTAESNGFDLGPGTIEVTPQELNGGGQVEVILRDQAPRFFSAFFLNTRVDFATRAVATYNSAASACILALDPTAGAAASFSGSSTLTLDGCSVMSNSNASNALNVQGAARLQTDCAIAVGGVTATSGLDLIECDAPITDSTPVADPYKNLPAVPNPGGCKNDKLATLKPGRYCGGLDIKGAVHLDPGEYYIDGDFTVNATAALTGSGVTIYVTNGGSVKVTGTPHIDLTAQTSGPWSGILFFGDRNSSMAKNNFTGDGSSSMTGAIYFPSQKVEYQGNFSGINGCTQVVARLVEWTGNATVGADCSALGMSPIPLLNMVRLTA